METACNFVSFFFVSMPLSSKWIQIMFDKFEIECEVNETNVKMINMNGMKKKLTRSRSCTSIQSAEWLIDGLSLFRFIWFAFCTYCNLIIDFGSMFYRAFTENEWNSLVTKKLQNKRERTFTNCFASIGMVHTFFFSDGKTGFYFTIFSVEFSNSNALLCIFNYTFWNIYALFRNNFFRPANCVYR